MFFIFVGIWRWSNDDCAGLQFSNPWEEQLSLMFVDGMNVFSRGNLNLLCLASVELLFCYVLRLR